MSLNLRFGLADDGDNSWELRKQAYPELIRDLAGDFVCVQEANDFQADFLGQLLQGYACLGAWGPAPENWQNNLVFAKNEWQLLAQRHLFLSRTPDRKSKLEKSTWPRQFTLGLFKQDNRRVLVATTHFDFLSSVQVTSARLINGFFSGYPDDIPMILTGDFNCLPGSKAHTVLTGSGFRDAFAGQQGFTFHGFTGEDRGGPIDWILYRGGLTASRARVITSQFSCRYPSDHFPVVADFMFSDKDPADSSLQGALCPE